MAFQFSTDARNDALDAIETTIGASAVLEIRSGAAPADCATADSGDVLATLNLPADWLAAASNGTKVKSGTWEDASADAAGTAGHFRVKDNGGTTCHIQGTVTATAGGGDMTLDNTSIAAGQSITVTSFSITAGGA
jgi:sulfur carrier protein ThiS